MVAMMRYDYRIIVAEASGNRRRSPRATSPRSTPLQTQVAEIQAQLELIDVMLQRVADGQRRIREMCAPVQGAGHREER